MSKMTPQESHMRDAASKIEKALPDFDTPHGQGALGRDDVAAKRAGYEGIEDAENQAAIHDELAEQAEFEGRSLADLLAEMAGDAPESSEGDEGTEDGSEEGSDEVEASEPQTFEWDELASQLPEGAKVRVKIDGEYQTVDVADLGKGYQRQADYTRKTQEIARQRHEVQQLEQAAAETREAYRQRLDYAEAIFSRMDPQALQTVRAEKERVSRELAAQAEYDHLTRLQSEQQRLIELIPEWRDESVAEKEKAELLQYAVDELGYSREELRFAVDARLVHLLKDAYAYRKLTSEGMSEVRRKAKNSPTLRPGQPRARGSSQQRQMKDARSKLRKTGNIRDAAHLLERYLDD